MALVSGHAPARRTSFGLPERSLDQLGSFRNNEMIILQFEQYLTFEIKVIKLELHPCRVKSLGISQCLRDFQTRIADIVDILHIQSSPEKKSQYPNLEE